MSSKKTKLTRALKSAARFPVRAVSGGRGTGRNTYSPISGESPIVLLRVQVLGCRDLLAKDRNGSSDPFVVVSLLNTRFQTPVSKRNINPTYHDREATFDFPIYLSLADKLGIIEIVVWDKDMIKKDYLGEVALPLDDWFCDRERNGESRPYAFDDPNNAPLSLNIQSTRARTNATGTIQIKLGFVTPPNTHPLLDFGEIFGELVKRSRPSLVSAPPTEGVGTVRSQQGGIEFQDDGGISSEEEDEGELDEDDILPLSLSHLRFNSPLPSPAILDHDEPSKPPEPPQSDITPTPTQTTITPSPPLASSSSSSAIPAPAPKRPTPGRSASSIIPRMKFRRVTTGNGNDAMGAVSDVPTTPIPVPGSSFTTTEKKKKFRKSWAGHAPAGYNFSSAENDIVGLVMLEIGGATDLPRLKNMTRTGWDMDPFVVVSFGKKVFRTRVIRHSRNPVWDEKLIFHVRRYETGFRVQLTVLDWDKLSSNDHIGDASFELKELLAHAPQRDPVTGLYDATVNGDHPMKDFQLSVQTAKEMPWESKHAPVLAFRAKYQPYDALRQQFWRYYLKQYDTDDTGNISHIELTSMLDSLGSTLTRTTVNSFFTRYGKNPHRDELTVPEAIICLETELRKPAEEKRRVDEDDHLPDTSVGATPLLAGGNSSNRLDLEKLSFSGPAMVEPSNTDNAGNLKPEPPAPYPTVPMQQPLEDVAEDDGVLTPDGGFLHSVRIDQSLLDSSAEDESSESASGTDPVSSSKASSNGVAAGAAGSSSSGSGEKKKKKRKFRRIKKHAQTGSGSTGSSNGGTGNQEDPLERVINVKNCPLCHRPRMNSKAEVDIIQHIAVCASQDWAKVDRIVVANFVTASQAQRKWYTKIITKISAGNYKLGANSANIIVQNRITGQLEEEKMQVYVRLGIRLLYKGAKNRMEGARARKLLKSLSIKQGLKYDSPASARDIPSFIEYHKLKVDEIRDPIESFVTFNKFFYRHLKSDARPIEEPDNPNRLVSAADCRLMTFETVNEATKLWIKGREFSVARLLGDKYRAEADSFNGGAVAIFRLAPQDYHRFHSPVDGKIGPMTYISGEYYTVNPQAIRTALDVYGENARKIVPIDSPHFGRVMAVCIGAMMVGSILTTVEEGQSIKRGEELGYFAFGGSTVVVLFQKGKVQWDEDLLINGRASLETLVRVGMGIGHGPR